MFCGSSTRRNKMASEDIQTFTKKMISEKVFACAVCENLLVAPVMVVENVGNVCHNCFETADEDNEWNSISNTKLNIILNGLKFPCKFESDGCDTSMFYENLKEHEEQCIFRPIDCLMPKEECEWNGRLIDLFKHFKEEHSRHVLNAPCDKFSFEMDLTKSANIIKLFNIKNRTYILKIKEIEKDNSLLHFLYHIKPTIDDSKMIVKYVGENGHHKIKVRRFPFATSGDETNGKKVRLTTLKDILEPSNNARVVIKAEKCELKDVNAEVIKQLECPVCKEVMRPRISQCTAGHSICQSCRGKVTECPTCRVSWGTSNIRNFSLEAITAFIQYPCAYNQFGCMATFFGNEIDKHEEICPHKMYTCPGSSCNFTGSYSSCKSHFRVNHEDDLIEGVTYQGNFVHTPNRSSSTTEIKYFFEHGNMYKFTFNHLTNACSWCIQILNHHDSSIKYFFEISISNPDLQQKRIIKSDLCLNQDATVTNTSGISFEYQSLSPYKNSSNSQINYCCAIIEHKSAQE